MMVILYSLFSFTRDDITVLPISVKTRLMNRGMVNPDLIKIIRI